MGEPRTITVWVVKHALTAGIKQEICEDRDGDGLIKASDNWTYYRLGKDAFESEAQARVAAREMQAAKLASLDKQRARIAKLEF